ncbi:mitochondrial carrier domain-containing protein [Blastocladiella britannica]|nr:mitochondrial carrier domain-containing protein [Blastocladiella britannica]
MSTVVAAAEMSPGSRVAREVLAGGLSCAVAGAITNPMDVVKIRMQLQRALVDEHQVNSLTYRRFFQSTQMIVAEEGLLGLLMPGMAASVMREMSYSALRFGLYSSIKRVLVGSDDPAAMAHAGIVTKFAAGMTSGAIGSCLANPFDLVKIRLQAEAGRIVDGVYVTGLRRGHPPTYSGTWSALTTIVRAEGFVGLYKGVSATAARASLLTAGQMASYDTAKHAILDQQLLAEGPVLHILSAAIAGLCAVTVAAPADLVKSRIMGDPRHIHYTGVLDCIVKTVRDEGPRAMFKGWLPSYLRIAPHFMISLPLFEVFRVALGVGTV